jgi:hypothetical protein
MVEYDAASTVRAARERYFEVNGFGAGGTYDQAWAPVKLGPLEFVIPNTAQRVRSLRLHDLHHIATGYGTTLAGESLIGAWELGSHCRDHSAAWVLNASAASFGLVLDPAGLWRAFVRGRRSRNLYDRPWDDAVLDRTVGELRRDLAVDGPHAARASDLPLFAALVAVGVALLGVTAALLPMFAVMSLAHRRRLRRLRRDADVHAS